MEKNRVLWVIFSISLFLVVVLAGGLYFLRPVSRRGAEAEAGQAPTMESFDAFEYVRGKSELPGLSEDQEGQEEMVIIVGEKEPEESAAEEAASLRAEQKAQRIASPLPTTVPEKAISPLPQKSVQPAPRPQKARPSTPKQAVRPAPRPAPREIKVIEYWIQAGSYTSPSRAEEIAGALEDQGLASKITTRVLSGKTYYRVRIGPYESKDEAEKFLSWVKAVQGFESSYISMVTSRRRVQ
jgi:cell division protein FtsN